MTKHIKLFSLFTLLLIVFSTARAGDDDWNSEKRKTVSKSYSLNNDSKVSIRNSFGNVTVHHWNQQEVKADITIIAKATTDDLAQAILNSIDIKSGGGSDPYFETKVETKNERKRNGRNSSIQINYEVYIPANTPLNVTNSFGNTSIPDREGELTVSQSYGNLKTGALSNIDHLSVEFGSLTSTSLQNTNATLKFSKVKIANLEGNFDGNFQFCTKPEISFSSNIQKVTIDSKYSDLTIQLPRALDVNFDITTNFGHVTNNSGIKLNKKDGKSITQTQYITVPAVKTDHKVYIRSEFGKILLQ